MAARQHGGTTLPATHDGVTIIGEGIHVNGRITGEEDLRIEGRVEGSISLTETVHVAESGVVVATIQARDVVVSGVVVGNVSATNAVHLNPGAKLVGDIDAPRLIIADGAAFRGNVIMSESPAGAARAKTAAAAPASRASAATHRPRVSASRASTTSASRPAPRATTAAPPRAERASATERVSERAAAPRMAAIRPPGRSADAPDEEVTVIVRHAALGEGDADATGQKKKAAKKVPPRGRVPKPGKRNVNRR